MAVKKDKGPPAVLAAAGSAGFWCYIGPSVGGVIAHGAVFRGDREAVLKAAGPAIRQVPPVKLLLVPGERLAQARRQVKEPGSALYAAARQVRELACGQANTGMKEDPYA